MAEEAPPQEPPAPDGFPKRTRRAAGQGSRFFFRTDYQPYYDEARAIIASHPQWRLLPDDSFPFEHVTIFQARAPVYHSLCARRSSPDPYNRTAPYE